MRVVLFVVVLGLVASANAAGLDHLRSKDEWVQPANAYTFEELTVEGDVLAEARLHARLRGEALAWAEEEVEPELKKIEAIEDDIAASVGWHRDDTTTTQVFTAEQVKKLEAMPVSRATEMLKTTAKVASQVKKNSKKLDERLLKHCKPEDGSCQKYQELLALHASLDSRKERQVTPEERRAEQVKTAGGSYQAHYWNPYLAGPAAAPAGQSFTAQPYPPGYMFYHNPGFDIDALYEEFNVYGDEGTEDEFLSTGVKGCSWYDAWCHTKSTYRATKRVVSSTADYVSKKTSQAIDYTHRKATQAANYVHKKSVQAANYVHRKTTEATHHVKRAYHHVKTKVKETIDDARALYQAVKKYWNGRNTEGTAAMNHKKLGTSFNESKCQACMRAGKGYKTCSQACGVPKVDKHAFLTKARALRERFIHLLPALYVAGISANINYLVGGTEFVFDFATGQAAWFYYGGASAGTNFVSVGGIGLYGGHGWKGRKIFNNNIWDAYSAYFLGIDIGVDVGVGSIFGQVCVSAKPFAIEDRIPLVTYPVFNEVITVLTGFSVGLSIPTAIGANVATTYYWAGAYWHCDKIMCQVAAIALSPSGPIAKAAQAALAWRWYCHKNPRAWVCTIFE